MYFKIHWINENEKNFNFKYSDYFNVYFYVVIACINVTDFTLDKYRMQIFMLEKFIGIISFHNEKCRLGKFDELLIRLKH